MVDSVGKNPEIMMARHVERRVRSPVESNKGDSSRRESRLRASQHQHFQSPVLKLIVVTSSRSS